MIGACIVVGAAGDEQASARPGRAAAARSVSGEVVALFEVVDLLQVLVQPLAVLAHLIGRQGALGHPRRSWRRCCCAGRRAGAAAGSAGSPPRAAPAGAGSPRRAARTASIASSTWRLSRASASASLPSASLAGSPAAAVFGAGDLVFVVLVLERDEVEAVVAGDQAEAVLGGDLAQLVVDLALGRALLAVDLDLQPVADAALEHVVDGGLGGGRAAPPWRGRRPDLLLRAGTQGQVPKASEG